MANLEISEDLHAALEYFAENDERPMAELVEEVLRQYIAQRVETFGELSTPEEIEAIKATLEEVNQPDAIWYTDEEFDEALDQEIIARRARKSQVLA